MMSKTKIKKLEEEVKDATQKADRDIKKSDEYYHDFMSDYAAYKSDLRRRSASKGLRKGNNSPKPDDKQPESGDKETKEVDS